MNRLLLALLALFAGLATQISPAQARMLPIDCTEIGAIDNGRSARPSPSSGAETDTPVMRQARREREASRPRPARPRVLIPTVLLGSDRAFE